MRRLKINVIAIISLVFLYNGLAFSGGIYDVENIVIDDNAKSAKGSVSRIRNTSDTTQILYCYKATVPGVSVSLNCLARNVNNVVRQCTTSDPVMMAEFASVNDSSYIEFRWNNTGACTVLVVGNGSPFGFRENK